MPNREINVLYQILHTTNSLPRSYKVVFSSEARKVRRDERSELVFSFLQTLAKKWNIFYSEIVHFSVISLTLCVWQLCGICRKYTENYKKITGLMKDSTSILPVSTCSWGNALEDCVASNGTAAILADNENTVLIYIRVCVSIVLCAPISSVFFFIIVFLLFFPY